MRGAGVGARRPVTHRRQRAGSALLLTLVSAVLVAIPASPASAAVRVPGIDVSKWQGDVDWAAVASTPVRYVIMRATIGN